MPLLKPQKRSKIRSDFPVPDARLDIFIVVLIISLTPTITIFIWFLTHCVSHRNIADLFPNLIPIRTRSRDRTDLTKDPVSAAGDDKPAEEIQIIDICSACGNGLSDGAYETDYVDEYTADIGRIPAPVEAEGEIVGGGGLGAVEVPDLVVPFADDVVICDDHTRDGREENGVGG